MTNTFDATNTNHGASARADSDSRDSTGGGDGLGPLSDIEFLQGILAHVRFEETHRLLAELLPGGVEARRDTVDEMRRMDEEAAIERRRRFRLL